MGAPAKDGRPAEYTHEYEMSDRYLYFDTDYLTNEEGRFKVVEVCLCLLGLMLGAGVHGERGERALTMLACSACILLTAAVWTCKVCTLHRQLTPKHWFCMEAVIILFLLGSLLTALVFMFGFGVLYTGRRNPAWQTLPVLCTCTLLVAAFIYFADLVLLFRHRNNRTYIPDVSSYRI